MVKIKQLLSTVCVVSSMFCLRSTERPYVTTGWTDKDEKEDAASMISESDHSSMDDGTVTFRAT